MKKPSKELPTTEKSTSIEIETKASKEEIASGKFDLKELEALMTALSLLVNKNIDGGILEIKIDPITKREEAIVYQSSDHKTVFMTEEELEIRFLRDPKRSLEMLVTELQEREANNKLIEGIEDDLTQNDKEV